MPSPISQHDVALDGRNHELGRAMATHTIQEPVLRGNRWSGFYGQVKKKLGSSVVYRAAVAVWMNILIAAVAVTTIALAYVVPLQAFPDSKVWAVGALKLFALWCLAFVPGWLYVRFLGLRAGVLWLEYVLHLHRLGWDQKGNLPAVVSASTAGPTNGAGPSNGAGLSNGAGTEANVYRQKFDAYYGRRVSRLAVERSDDNFRVSVETLFPVFLCTSVLAVGWAAVLWDTDFMESPSGPWDALKFGFIGAYAFAITMLTRRFYQSDLRPSAYDRVVLRIVEVILIVAVLHHF